MGLEVVQYISDLNTGWPAPTDKIRFGDDHLRNIKAALRNTFPGLNGAMVLTEEQLNAIPEWQEAFVAHLVPTGAIMLWSGAADAIPIGWALCNGAGGTPDLRGRFIIGAGGTYAVGDTGGAEDVTTEATIVAVTVAEHVLTTPEMPAHKHLMFIDDHDDDPLTNANQAMVERESGSTYKISGGAAAATLGLTALAGGGAGHAHDAESDPHSHTIESILPPYFALCYIMKTLTWDL